MVIRELLKKAIEIIKESNSVTPQLDASVLLCYVLNCDKVYLIINDQKEITIEQEKHFFELVEKRRRNMPVAYITNTQEFMSLDFYVDENVLIPRADTEILVEHILNTTVKKNKILDLCCGSGCIGISLAYYLKNVIVHMADISDDALKVTQKNIKSVINNDCIVKTFKIDILKEIPSETYDILVSNPPYIDVFEMQKLEENVVGYEPRLALEGGEDGLDFYRRISHIAPLVLNKGGMLVFEIGEKQGDSVCRIMQDNGFENIKIINDLAGRNRVVEGRIKEI